MTEDENIKYQTILQVAEEIVYPEEVKNLIQREDHPCVYDGFEQSGRLCNFSDCGLLCST